MDIRKAYEDSLSREGHVRDSAQLDVIERLEDLQRRIQACKPTHRGLFGLLSRTRQPVPSAVKGLYIWGGVGRGKTFLMDLFFDSLRIEKKKRIHFHRMMHDVHARLLILGDIEDPLDTVADNIASATQVLCFDEFFISDIADAMILGRLLDGLFRRGVTLVATSNSRPDDLYREGLQRQRFLPAIDLINVNTDVIHMDSGTDYRLRLLQKAGTFLTPDDDQAEQKLSFFFDESATSQIRTDRELEINGRRILARKCAKGIAWFDFAELCDGPRSQSDYIELARWYPSVIVSGVPVLDPLREDQARRFIALVDEFYDRRVKLILSAETRAESLYTGDRLAFEFNRTMSRLIEMQSSEYLALPHLA
ncbi:MAG: cell division protein ZapE [Gammaproteobacteria bacterium]|nr:cell division protein ZapE [Gammaproteobacteria bacterium]